MPGEGFSRTAAARLRAPWGLLAACALLALCLGAPPGVRAADTPARPSSASAAARTITKGSLELRACGASGAYCGTLDRPLDPQGVMPGRIGIHFEFYRHSNPGPAAGTLVATEGGPGYPATESRDDYLALFRPLMGERDVVIMDNRGTGRSGAIDCHALQTAEKWTVELVAACGESLGARAPLYSTALAADDLAAILDGLGVRRIDLYGDSYGTYFEQVFAVRHPRLLRSLVLDGAYPLTGPDYAWYPTYAPAMRDKLNWACERSAPCAALPGSSIEHITPALRELRASPFAARGFDVDGREREFQANAALLAIVMFGNAPALTTTREVDAAARAFAEGDRLPLLRLMAETSSAVDSRDPTGDAAKWSAGLAAAVLCQDPPQIFDMSLPPAARALERDRALAQRRQDFPDTYAPFTIDEYRAMPLDYSFLDECVGWPAPPADHPASQVGANAVYPDVPALVISGDLDSVTTLADGAAVAHAFPRGMQLRIVNGFHVNALPRGRSACAANIARRFLATLTPGDTSCTARAPPVRLVGSFATHAAALEPAFALSGNAADQAALRVASAVASTVADVAARALLSTSGTGVGLRGGAFRVHSTPAAVRISLDGVRWVEDVRVSGTIHRTPGRVAAIKADVRLTSTAGADSADASPAGGTAGRLTIRWSEGVDPSWATITGQVGGSTVAARMPAP
jgi:pimeloyl-ACP methyl ester carboxylesterase